MSSVLVARAARKAYIFAWVRQEDRFWPAPVSALLKACKGALLGDTSKQLR
jgi:hypothetical protein